jgi:hypothetical protein
MSEPCRCDQPTCPLCHPVMSRIIAGELGGEGRGVNIIDQGAPMPETLHDDDIDAAGFGTFLVIVGIMIAVVTITLIIAQQWGYSWAALWVAGAAILAGVIVHAAARSSLKRQGHYDGFADD